MRVYSDSMLRAERVHSQSTCILRGVGFRVKGVGCMGCRVKGVGCMGFRVKGVGCMG